jgi:hypothetical protein
MGKHSIILILLLMICSLSCNTRQKVTLNENFIKSISEENQNTPSRFFNLLFFCKCQDNEIQYLNVYELRETYSEDYSNINYHTFLTDLLNQRIKIKCKNQKNKFKIDENVRKTYKEKNTNDFINLYCTKKGDNLFWLKSNTIAEQRNTILYFLFANNYLTSIDDYSGAFIIRKIE